MDPSYAAGLIDGEGYIGIGHVKRANTYVIRVQVAMVTKGTPILSQMRRQWGGRISVRPPETERNVAKDAWVVDGRAAYDFLSQIRPHLVLKGDQADCCIQLWEAILANRERKGRHHWDDALRRHAHHLMLRLQEGNQRGPVEPPPPPLSGRDLLAVRRWGEWWEPEEDLFGPRPLTRQIPTSGTMRSGRIYSAPDQIPLTEPAERLLPTPRPQTNAGGLRPDWTLQDRRARNGVTGGANLATTVAMLAGWTGLDSGPPSDAGKS